MCNYFLIPMSFLECDFEKLGKEWKSYKKIMWQVPGSPVYKEKIDKWEIKPNAKMPGIIKSGDIIYFYICKIPSNGGKEKSRILLRGIVDEVPHPVKYEEVYLEDRQNTPEVIIGFSVRNLTTLSKIELENDSCYCKEILQEKYVFYVPQGKFWPNTVDNNLDEKLVENLEGSFKKSGMERDFDVLTKHFSRKCFFSGKIGTEKENKTFKRRNGTDYYEIHHFIPQNSTKNKPEMQRIVDASENKICLCSNCHNKLHYGKPDEIKQMIRCLWNSEDIHRMLQAEGFSSVIGVENECDVFNWIEKVYQCR